MRLGIYLNNNSLMQALAPLDTNPGTVRETIFYNQMSTNHEVSFSHIGDFKIDDELVFEVGGKNKDTKQIKELKPGENAFIAADDIEYGYRHKIPLWMFGFTY